MKINKSNIAGHRNRFPMAEVLIVILVGVIVALIVFDKDPNPSDGLEAERDMLLQQKENLQVVIDGYKIEVKDLKDKDEEWIEKDSLKDLEIAKAQAQSEIERQKLRKAEKERKEAQKALKEFRENPPTIDNPIDLILDTKKKINSE